MLGATKTRKGFLERIFNPLLSANQDRPYTLAEAIREVSIGADKLHKLGKAWRSEIPTKADFFARRLPRAHISLYRPAGPDRPIHNTYRY